MQKLVDGVKVKLCVLTSVNVHKRLFPWEICKLNLCYRNIISIMAFGFDHNSTEDSVLPKTRHISGESVAEF